MPCWNREGIGYYEMAVKCNGLSIIINILTILFKSSIFRLYQVKTQKFGKLIWQTE